jgi:hypothetical protein
MVILDCAIAQAVRRWLPTVAVRVRVRTACRVCGGQSGAGFRRLPMFPCQSFHQFLRHPNHTGLAQ